MCSIIWLFTATRVRSIIQRVQSVIRSIIWLITVTRVRFLWAYLNPKLIQRFHSFIRSDVLLTSTDFILISLTMAYGIGGNIALLKWEINEADFLWNWNYFSSLIQIYELCFQHKILNCKYIKTVKTLSYFDWIN